MSRKEKNWNEIAEDVIKYQNFQTKVAVKHIRGNVSSTTKKNYLIAGRHYLQTGKIYKNVNVGPHLFNALEIAKQKCVQPLTPKESERARLLGPQKLNYAKKNADVPIKHLEILKKPTTARFEYGVRFGDIIYLQKDDKTAEIFLSGIKATGNEAKIISVEIGEV